jgi:uncharacterized DUF497 family protein
VIVLRWTWDVEKARKNLEKHRVSFELAERALGDPFAISVPNAYPNEDRWTTLGSPNMDGRWFFTSSIPGQMSMK